MSLAIAARRDAVGRRSPYFAGGDMTLAPHFWGAGLGHTMADVVFHSPVTMAGYESHRRPTIVSGDFRRGEERGGLTRAPVSTSWYSECGDRLRYLTVSGCGNRQRQNAIASLISDRASLAKSCGQNYGCQITSMMQRTGGHATPLVQVRKSPGMRIL